MKTLMSTIFASLTICWIAAAQDSQVSKSNDVITPDQTTTAHMLATGEVTVKPESTDIDLTASEAAHPAPPVAEKSKTIVIKKLLGPNGEPTFRKNGHYYYMDKDGKPVEINSDVADAKAR
ncbi:MAG TPA: hypothetical protein VFZ52_06520 [Chryseolinea sp.]